MSQRSSQPPMSDLPKLAAPAQRALAAANIQRLEHLTRFTEAEIKQFSTLKYNVSFPMFAKVKVKGSDPAPLYQYLTSQPGKTGAVKWNFSKFLVGQDGQLIDRYDSGVEPLDRSLTQAIEAALR